MISNFKKVISNTDIIFFVRKVLHRILHHVTFYIVVFDTAQFLYFLICVCKFLMVTLSDFAGFDPFHETQKGLADLLESESKAAEAQQHQQVSTINNTTRNCNMWIRIRLRILLRLQALPSLRKKKIMFLSLFLISFFYILY
jgi:hypothetical protein